MKNFLLYSTMVGVFSEAAFVDIGFEFKLIYIIIFINYFIILKLKKTLVINLNWLLVLFYVFLSGLLTTYLFNNQISKVVFQVFGMTFMSTYFYNFFLCYDFDVVDIFKKYCNACFILSLIGIPLFFVLVSFDHSYRLHSLLQEPAHFCGIVLPAFYYFMTNFKLFKIKFIVVFIALLMSLSSIGYIGMLIGFVMIRKKINLFITGSLIFIALIVGLLAYSFIGDVKYRADDTLSVLNELNVSNVNSSTLALTTNAYVAFNAFLSSPIIGRGIGSQPISFKKYVYQIIGIEGYEGNDDLLFLNSTDGASLTIRTMSELGLVGLCGIIFFIVKYYTGNYDYYKISRAIILYFLYKLIREGHYFPPEMYFFAVMYCTLNIKAKKNILLVNRLTYENN